MDRRNNMVRSFQTETRVITTNWEGHNILIKGKIQQEDIKFLTFVCMEIKSKVIKKSRVIETQESLLYDTLYC